MGFFSKFGEALIGAGSSLVGNLFGAASQSSANKSNREINQMNNEFNERMMQKQMDYNTMMWNKQNAYNTPEAQRKRLEAAGLNPFLMMNGGSSGNAQSAGSTSMASAAGAAPQQAFLPDFSGIPQSILMAKQGANIDADTESKVIDNQTRAMKNMQEIANTIARTNNEKLEGKLKETLLSYADQMQMEQLRNLKASADKISREVMMADKALAVFDDRTKLEFAQMASQIDLNKFNAQHEISQLIDTAEKKIGRKLSKSEKDDIFDAVKKTIIFKPTSSMSSYGAAATIGSVVGHKIKQGAKWIYDKFSN